MALTPFRSMLLAGGIAAVTVFNIAMTQPAAEQSRPEAGARAELVAHPPTDRRNAHYVSNRAPLTASPLVQLPIKAIEPQGWLRKTIELQAEGFHGNLGEISRFLAKEGNSWLDPKGQGDHGWEEVPYWLKGFAHAAYVLDDPEMIAEAQVWIDGAINSQQENGWFGPQKARSTVQSTEGEWDLWPNMVMLFALQSYYDYTGDERVIELMQRYFRWQLELPEEQFLPPYWQQQRAADNLWSVYWLYNRTGEEWLLELAEKINRRVARWDEKIPNWHNVNIAQAFDSGAVYWQQSKDPAHLASADRNWRRVRELYGQVPGGMFGADENARPGFTGPRQAIETCGIVEEMLSDEQLLLITGDPVWADRAEDAAFNSLPAALTADMKGLRYLTAPNHPQSDAASKAPGIQNGGPMYLMDPNRHRCCQHNFGHGWPYLATSLWMATSDNGLAAVFYSESEVTAKVGDDGAEVTIAQETHYPFEETVRFTVSTAEPVSFPLYLRIPGWLDKREFREFASVAINGSLVQLTDGDPGYIVLDREWRNGDTVELTLPMKVRVRQWGENHESVSVDRGPLTYSLKIEEEYRRAGGSEEWPAHEIWPASPWNYALALDDIGLTGAEGVVTHVNLAAQFEVVQRPWPQDDMPWTHAGTSILIRAKGRRIPQWGLDERGLVEEIQESPVKTAEPVEDITLIPMGAARLRISAFPVAGDGPDAHEWTKPVPPTPQDYVAKASHCWAGDRTDAIGDGAEPRSSSDETIPRHTFWPNKGTSEWVEVSFPEARNVSGVAVYWFDDTPGGGCKVPASWRLLYREGDEWKPVQGTGDFGVEKDALNELSFAPVETDALRLEIQLQENFSAGILELRVEPRVERTASKK